MHQPIHHVTHHQGVKVQKGGAFSNLYALATSSINSKLNAFDMELTHLIEKEVATDFNQIRQESTDLGILDFLSIFYFFYFLETYDLSDKFIT